MSDFLKLKYLPYVILQICLVLCAYILKSDKYQHFKSEYMDVETQKQEALKREDERWQKANRSALSGKGGSKAGGSISGGKSAKEGGSHEGNKNIFFNEERSVHSSMFKEGGEKDSKNEDDRE
jgi:hypothetical protein